MVEVKPSPDIEIPDCVVGIDTHLSKIESFSFSDINSEEVQMIGIYGVRGTGKTILAKKVYHDHKSDFEYKSLAEGIKHRAKENYQIVEVQKAILSEILGETDVPVYNAEEGAKHCEVDGENKQVGEMRTLVLKKLNKMFKRGQWGADSTGRLDKTLEQILREAMDDMSIQEKCSEVEREDDDSLEKEEESENSSESEEESEEESSEDQAKSMTNKPSSDSRIVASSSQVSNGYNYEHGKELIQQNPYATNFYGFGTSREYHHNYPMTIPGYNAPPIPPIPGYYPMMRPMRLGTSNEYNFCPTGESGRCHCQDCAMKFSPEFRPY
nr:disease resistance protein tao1 [Quercus suber]